MTPRRCRMLLVIALACVATPPPRDATTIRPTSPGLVRSEARGSVLARRGRNSPALPSASSAYVAPASLDDQRVDVLPLIETWSELPRPDETVLRREAGRVIPRVPGVASTHLRC